MELFRVNLLEADLTDIFFILLQWTVNGQLRVGFFTTKAVTAGTELTFDYQFQRYGYSFLYITLKINVFIRAVI